MYMNGDPIRKNIDMPLCVYSRKRKKKDGSEQIDVEHKDAELALAVESDS